MNFYSMIIIGIYLNVFSLNIKIKVSKNNLSEERVILWYCLIVLFYSGFPPKYFTVEMEKIHDCDFEILSDFIVF